MISRRQALASMLATGALTGSLTGCSGPAEARTVLPPTAGDDFLDACIRCRRCGEVCTAGCISFHPPRASPELAGTPYIEPRRAGCNTCTRCTQVCPSGALTPIEPDEALEVIEMGVAFVDPGLCLSFLGRVCGVCHDACPFPGDAIALGVRAQPQVLALCVGCGRCEERCPQTPAAIRVFRTPPDSERWEGPA